MESLHKHGNSFCKYSAYRITDMAPQMQTRRLLSDENVKLRNTRPNCGEWKPAANGRLKEDEAINHFQQLINVVDYCHSRGDAFVGGFLSQLVKQKPIEECVRVKHSMLSSKGQPMQGLVNHTPEYLQWYRINLVQPRNINPQPNNNDPDDMLNEDLEAHHHHQQCARMCNAPPQQNTSVTDTMPNYDMEPPFQFFALSPSE
ncbi:hypothetical protein JHK82_018500 [Glycine max]|nr:hypothetical protein JHK85_018931 [Glycine max]KAG5037685.1 hypothetical protein JHK86_018525 [Glycine max]KAG5142805.1 hypothetical protein JHK82_018500 [Glycine max]